MFVDNGRRKVRVGSTSAVLGADGQEKTRSRRDPTAKFSAASSLVGLVGPQPTRSKEPYCNFNTRDRLELKNRPLTMRSTAGERRGSPADARVVSITSAAIRAVAARGRLGPMKYRSLLNVR
jgi:hypothetical protein